jgi:hypothetical protein
MKTLSRINTAKGTTLVEIAVAVSVLGLLGLVFFQVLNSGLILYAKNTAVNTAHEEAREGINRLTRDIHASISVPQLRNASFNVVSSAPVGGVPPTAAAVSFQNIASGPNFVWKDPTSPGLIMIKDNGVKPKPGMRLIIPFWGLEEDITKITAAGTTNHTNVFILADQSTPQIDAPDYGGSYAITYYTYRTMYLVKNGQYIADSQGPWILSGGSYVAYTSGTMQRYRYENGELHLYRQDYNGSATYWKDMATVAKYISSPQPFYIPLNSGGSPDTKYVGVKLTARDPKSSNRGFLASASLLDTQVDYRSRICLSQ